jgi:hypothetical protein
VGMENMQQFLVEQIINYRTNEFVWMLSSGLLSVLIR